MANVERKHWIPQEIPNGEKVFDAAELRNYLKPVWEKLDRVDEAVPFRVPVDPELLHIPDYFDVIKRPMDLMTIYRKLERGVYKNPREFCDDVWLMFDNAWLYNRKNSKVYKWCTKLSEIFVEEIEPVMEKLGYCCGPEPATAKATEVAEVRGQPDGEAGSQLSVEKQ